MKRRRSVPRSAGPKRGPTGHDGAEWDVCPVRLAALRDEDVLRSTWAECLRGLREYLTAVCGPNPRANAERALERYAALLLVSTAMSLEVPCCLEGNMAKVRISRCAAALQAARLPMLVIDAATRSPEQSADLPGVIGTILPRIPSDEELAGLAVDLRVPFCLCPGCVTSMTEISMVFGCRYCGTLMEVTKRALGTH